MKKQIGQGKRAVTCALCTAVAVNLAGCGQNGGVQTDAANQAAGQNGTETDGSASEDSSIQTDNAAEGIVYRVNTEISGLDDSHRISDTLFGIFLEDINYAVDGGMYAELLKNRSFEYGMEARDAQMHGWEATSEAVTVSVQDGSGDGTSLNENNPQYVVVENSGASSVSPTEGISNKGFLEGIAIEEGASYGVSFYCKSEDGSVDQVCVTLFNEDGTVYDEKTVEGITDQWQKYEVTLTANATANRKVRLAVKIPAGTACFDMISMMPQDTYQGLPIRKDFGEYLEALHPAFMRFPGGCVVEGRDEESIYSWKDSIGDGLSFEINGETTVGDIAVRPQGKSIWQGSAANPYYTTYGLGFYEYFEFCEALGCMPVPVLNAGMTCEIQSPFYKVYDTASAEFSQYVQDAHEKLNQWVPDLIFYSNDGIFGSANYYVQQMYGNNAGEHSLDSTLAGAPEQTLYESAADAGGDVILKLVNVSDENMDVNVVLEGREMACFLPEAEVTVLTGADQKAMNSFKEMAVQPQESKMTVSEEFVYTAPARSLTVIRMTALKD